MISISGKLVKRQASLSFKILGELSQLCKKNLSSLFFLLDWNFSIIVVRTIFSCSRILTVQSKVALSLFDLSASRSKVQCYYPCRIAVVVVSSFTDDEAVEKTSCSCSPSCHHLTDFYRCLFCLHRHQCLEKGSSFSPDQNHFSHFPPLLCLPFELSMP